MRVVTPARVLLSKVLLHGNEAHSLLNQLTGCQIPSADFASLINQHNVCFYLKVHELNFHLGKRIYENNQLGPLVVDTEGGKKTIIPSSELVKVLKSQLSAHSLGKKQADLCEFDLCRFVLSVVHYPGVFESMDENGDLVRWKPDQEKLMENLPDCSAVTAFFKPADIEKLASIMYGLVQPEIDTAEIDQLRQRIEALTKENAKLRVANASNAADGIVFPYSTPELEVMRDLAIQYWVGYNPVTDKKPQQKDVGIELTTRMRWSLSSGGTASRQASPLATAIQPKEYRERK